MSSSITINYGQSAGRNCVVIDGTGTHAVQQQSIRIDNTGVYVNGVRQEDGIKPKTKPSRVKSAKQVEPPK